MPRERKNAKKNQLDADGQPIPKVKKRRTSTMTAGTGNNSNNANGGGPSPAGGGSGSGNELAPPLPSHGDTLYASNPFDDLPSSNGGGVNMGRGPPTPSGHQFMPGDYPPGYGPGGPPMHQHPMGPPPGKPGMIPGGKTYPSDVPRVMNPANPNAPPIYPCGICHREVHDNDQAILCESGCNFWYHRSCTGLSETAFIYLNEDVYAEWACDNCMGSKKVPLVKLKP